MIDKEKLPKYSFLNLFFSIGIFIISIIAGILHSFSLTIAIIVLYLFGNIISRYITTNRRENVFLFNISFFVKIIWALIFFIALFPACSFSDDVNYFEGGTIASLQWQNGQNINFRDLAGGYHYGYYIYNAIFQFLFGKEYIFPVLGNVLFSSFAAVLMYRLVQEMGYKKYAFLSGISVALMPSFVFWAGVNLKDTFFYFLILFITLTYILFRNTNKIKYFLSFLLLSVIGSVFRGYIIFILIFIFLIDFLIKNWTYIKKKLPIFIIFTAGIVFILFQPIFSNLLQSLVSGEIINQVKQEKELSISGGTSIYGPSLITQLPIGLIRFLTTPIPWKTIGLYKGLISDAIIWLAIFPFFIFGFFLFTRSSWKKHSWLLLIIIIIALFYSVVLAEQGPRHRLQIMPFCLFLTVYGIKNSIKLYHSRSNGFLLLMLMLILWSGLLIGVSVFQ